MRDLRLCVAVLCLALSTFATASGAWAEEGRRSVVVISIDGLRPSCYTNAEALGLEVPNLRHLMQRGAYAEGVIGVMPTLTYPSHTTLITGVTPRVHGIESNAVFDPEKRTGDAWNWYARYIKVPTLVSAARDAGLHSATIWWPVAVGIGSDWNLPEFWRPGSENAFDLNLLDAVSTPGLLDAVTRDRGHRFAYPVTDAERTDTAVYVLKTHHPELTLIHLAEVDSASHRFGPNSREALAAVEAADARVGLILKAIDDAGMASQTVVAVVSDHGFLDESQSLQPNTILRKAGFITTDARGHVVQWRAFFHSQSGSAALMLKDPGDSALAARIRALFEPMLKDPSSGLRAILDPARIAAMGGAEGWVLALDAENGFALSETADGKWAVSAKSRGGHGQAPDRPELYASLIVSSSGLARSGDLGIVRMTAIAPTLAAYLHLRLAPEAEAPLALW